MENQEIEVKFYVQNLAAVEKRLLAAGAHLIQKRILEQNLRFDTPEQDLGRSFRVLRLRQDTEARLTYKGPSSMREGTRVREEIEFSVSDFNRARQLLEALGFQISMSYEKFRSSYDLNGAHIVLDELPYGNFVEIEGPDVGTIRSINEILGLNWNAGVAASYTALFERLKHNRELEFRDLTFENFIDLDIQKEDLEVIPADE